MRRPRGEGHANRAVAHGHLIDDTAGIQIDDGDAVGALIGDVGLAAVYKRSDGHTTRIDADGQLGHGDQRAQIHQRKRVRVRIDDEQRVAVGRDRYTRMRTASRGGIFGKAVVEPGLDSPNQGAQISENHLNLLNFSSLGCRAPEADLSVAR
jgi:hypothetical protein